MKKQISAHLFSLCAALLLLGVVSVKAVAQCPKAPSKEAGILTVDFCEVTASPHKYEDKTIRIQATYSNSFEGATLYRSDCPNGEKVLTVLLDCKNDDVCNELRIKLQKDAEGNPFDGESVDVIVTGHVKALYPKGVKNRANTSRALFYIKDVEKTAPASKP